MNTIDTDSVDQHCIVGIILSGGAGRRFAGKDKGLLLYNGVPLIQQVVDVVDPQVDNLIISINRNNDEYQTLGHALVNDVDADYGGPIAGILSAFDFLQQKENGDQYSHALICTCDSPSLPGDYVQRLMRELLKSNAAAALVNDGERKQNLHCLIARKAWPALRNFYNNGGRAMHRWHANVNAIEVDFLDEKSAFTNINSPEQLR